MKLGMILLLSVIAIGCGYGSNYNSMTGGMSAPQITQLSPSQVAAGSPAFNLIITGSGFTSGSVVYWGLTPLTSSTTNSATQVTATISASLIANSGAVSLYVHTSGGNSNSMTFTIM